MASNSNRREHTADRRSPRATARARLAMVVLSLALMAGVGAAAAVAGSCRVLIALGAVDLEPSPAGLSVRLSGSWEFDNLVQVVSGLSFNVLLVRENSFVRFRYPDQTFAGLVSGLGGRINAGLDGNDILAVETASGIEPTARFVTVEAQRMKLSSPIPPGEGPISVVAYMVLDDDYISPIVSNAITRAIEVEPIKESENSEEGSASSPDPAAGEAP